MENTTLIFKIELTARQAEILRPWENMIPWLENYLEKEIYSHLEQMSFPSGVSPTNTQNNTQTIISKE